MTDPKDRLRWIYCSEKCFFPLPFPLCWKTKWKKLRALFTLAAFFFNMISLRVLSTCGIFNHVGSFPFSHFFKGSLKPLARHRRPAIVGKENGNRASQLTPSSILPKGWPHLDYEASLSLALKMLGFSPESTGSFAFPFSPPAGIIIMYICIF